MYPALLRTNALKVDPKLIHRLFYPQVPAVLSAKLKGRVSAMPVVSYAAVSDSPPLVAVACNPKGFTCKLAIKARAFSLSLLGRSQLGALEKLAATSGAKASDKLKAAGLDHRQGAELRVPVIESAEATLECRLRSKVTLGDHLLLVGLVEAAYSTAAFSEFWDFHSYRPVLYTGWTDRMTTYSED
jgi:flavin reductase (DIM6/NTAB) family NADH-FMN oxidoreductase RutF